MAKCCICNIRNAVSESKGSTCTDSYCSEASYYFNTARNARRNSAKQREAFARANEVQEKAISWARSA